MRTSFWLKSDLGRWMFDVRYLCLVLASLAWCCESRPSLGASLQCGAAAVDVTPRNLPVIRNGGFLEARDTRVLDPLHARCVVMDDGDQRLAIVVVDSCMIPVDVCDRAKQLAHETTGIAIDRIMISATHTHSAPSVMDYCLGSRADITYRDYLPGRIADSIRIATDRLQPARLGWAVVDASSHTKCRRWITRSDNLLVDPFGEATVNAMMHPGHQNPGYTGPSGPIDPWLSVLMVQSLEKQPIALFANLSMHYFSGHAGVSADYYGRFAEQIGQQIAPDNPQFVGLMSQGTSGDLWWGDYSQPKDRKPFESIDQFTRDLVDLTIKATGSIEFRSDTKLDMAEKRMTIGRRLPDEQRLAWARRMNRIRGDRLPKDRPEVYAMQAVYLHENPTAEVVLQAIRIGDLAITGMPNEVYALTGLKLKRQSPFDTTFNVSLANGASGYIPPPEQHALGGYTTWPSRTAGLEVQAEPKIVEDVIRLLEELADKPRRAYQESETSYSKQILASQPIAFWRFAELQGPTAADATGNDCSLRYSGKVAFHLPGRQAAFGSRHNTHSVHLAGGHLVADNVALGESYTVEFSFYLGTPNDFRAETATLISRGEDRLRITGTGDETCGRLAFGRHTGHSEVAPHTWQHIVFVRNGDFVEVYLNGNTDPEISARAPPTKAMPNRLYLGGDSQGSASLEGKVDEASVYERALTRAEVLAHFRAAGSKLEDPETRGLDSAPLDPPASMQQIHVREAYRVELVASEPLVQDPVALDWAPDGRLWVAEMADYPMGMDGKGKPGGRIRWLEDTDQDGRYDKSVVFMKDVSFPNGVMAWRNGVIVTAAPDIFYAEDRDGDGVADFQVKLFTGFVTGNQQLRVNGLRWGLDNWIHCASGAHHAGFGSSTSILSVALGSRHPLGSRDFRFRPDTGQLDPQSGPSQYGRVRDDWGNWFGVQNSQPLWHYVLADSYTRRNPHVPSIDPRRQVRVPRMPRVYSSKPPQKRFHGFDHAGHYTSACGISIYRDDILFPRSEIHAFTCEPFHNLVQHHILTEDGTSFLGQRADDGPIDFFASADRWTRPVMTRTGPDGAVWIVDMYRYMIEHPEWLPTAGKEELRPGYRAGEHLGRIYRVVPETTDCRLPPRMIDASSRELAEFVGHENGVVRDMAHRLILSRADEADISRCRRIALNHPLAEARLQALCLLEGLGQCDNESIVRALNDSHPAVRRHAIRIAETSGASVAKLRAAVLKRVNDADDQVRHQLACTLGQWPHSEAGHALAQLALRPDNDAFADAAIISSAETHYSALIDVVIAEPDHISDSLFNALLLTTEKRRDELSRLLSSNLSADEQPWSASRVARLTTWLDLLKDRNQQLSSLTIQSGDALTETVQRLNALMQRARRVAIDEQASEATRASAISLLGREEDKFVADTTLLASLVAPQLPKPVQLEAIGALARIPHPQVATELVQRWTQMLPEARAIATDALLSRTPWTHVLLDALRQGDIATADINLTHRQRLLTSRDAAVAQAAHAILEDPRDDVRSEVIKKYESATVLVGRREDGQRLFDEHCKTCHAIDKTQRLVGPDLRTLTNRSPRALLSSILDPSQAIDPRYQNYNVILQSGEVLAGLVGTENSNSIEIVDAEGKRRVILRDSIDLIQQAPLSLMPVGFEQKMSPSQMNDLIAFLMELGAQE